MDNTRGARTARASLAVLMIATCCMTASAATAAAATKMVVRGTVSCSQGKAPVAIWIASSGGGSGLVGKDWIWRFASKGANGSYAYFEKTITSSTSKSTINVHVGCGGKASAWGKDLWSADYKGVGSKGRTINLACDYAKKPYVKGACTSAPKGISLGTNPKSNPYNSTIGYCTGGAVQFWFDSAKYWPKVNRSVKNTKRMGDAKLMDDNARDNGFRVLPVPTVRSMVVFNKQGSQGHVGWVTKVYKKSGKPVFDYKDRNGGDGLGIDRMRYGKAWDSTQAFIVAPN
jgi:hypothetical protein